MIKEDLIKYCKSIGLVECKRPEGISSFSVSFRVPSSMTHELDFIAAYDKNTDQVVLADKVSIYESFPKAIRMLGQRTTSHLSDEAIMRRIDELTKEVAETILLLKYKNMKTRISKLNGDFN